MSRIESDKRTEPTGTYCKAQTHHAGCQCWEAQRDEELRRTYAVLITLTDDAARRRAFIGWRVKATDEGCYLGYGLGGCSKTLLHRPDPIGLKTAAALAQQWRTMGRPAVLVRVYRRVKR